MCVVGRVSEGEDGPEAEAETEAETKAETEAETEAEAEAETEEAPLEQFGKKARRRRGAHIAKGHDVNFAALARREVAMRARLQEAFHRLPRPVALAGATSPEPVGA